MTSTPPAEIQSLIAAHINGFNTQNSMVQLDDAVTRWLPEFRPKLPNGDAPRIDVRHLLTHTAGLAYRMLQPTV